MNKSPVQLPVVSLVCLVIVNLTAVLPSAAEEGSTGGSARPTTESVGKALEEAFSLGSGRPCPSMDFGGMGIMSPQCRHPTPGRHDSPAAPCKKSPAYEVPIAKEQTSTIRPPEMSGIDGPNKPTSISRARPEQSWTPDRLHMPLSNTDARSLMSSAVSQSVPNKKSAKQVVSKITSSSKQTLDKADRIRDRIHKILSDKPNGN